MVAGDGQVKGTRPLMGAGLCAGTRLPIPECSCRSCLENQLRRHAPHLIGEGEGDRLETAPRPS
jgi:hypothetical protein